MFSKHYPIACSQVEAIVGHKTKRGESFFLVRWKGYGKDADSWEPEADLNCDDLIAEYRKVSGTERKNCIWLFLNDVHTHF